MPVAANSPTNEPKPRGGPRTREGKNRSRRNALKHGMTSTQLVPNVLRAQRVDYYREVFSVHFQPPNALERVLVDELARHAAMLELSEQGEGAVLRHSALELSSVIGSDQLDGTSREDAILAAAFATDALDKFSRYRKGHEKAFYTALKRLLEIQEARRAVEQEQTKPQDVLTNALAQFSTDQACVDYLRQRFSKSDWQCPRCGCGQGSWLAKKQRWECRECRRQVGLRYGTVMERSRLPILTWVRAIQLVRLKPKVATEEACETLGITRAATVSNVLSKIRQATSSPQAAQLLGGLGSSQIRA